MSYTSREDTQKQKLQNIFSASQTSVKLPPEAGQGGLGGGGEAGHGGVNHTIEIDFGGELGDMMKSSLKLVIGDLVRVVGLLAGESPGSHQDLYCSWSKQ